MTLSEAIEGATKIVDGYPNGGRDAGKGYIGALAAMLASYPRQVALKCSDRVHGVIRDCRFLPTPADIVAWCEPKTESLRNEHARELQVATLLEQREQDLQTGTQARRLSIEELKEKYGDWTAGRNHGGTERELADEARARLVEAVGRAAFDALPNQPLRSKMHQRARQAQ